MGSCSTWITWFVETQQWHLRGAITPVHPSRESVLVALRPHPRTGSFGPIGGLPGRSASTAQGLPGRWPWFGDGGVRVRVQVMPGYHPVPESHVEALNGRGEVPSCSPTCPRYTHADERVNGKPADPDARRCRSRSSSPASWAGSTSGTPTTACPPWAGGHPWSLDGRPDPVLTSPTRTWPCSPWRTTQARINQHQGVQFGTFLLGGLHDRQGR